MQVSKKLGLDPISKGMTAGQRRALYVLRIERLKKHLKKGDMSPKLSQRCEEYIRSAEYKIRQIDTAKKAPKAKPSTKATVIPVDPRLVKAAAAVDAEVARTGKIDGVKLKAPKAKPVDTKQGILPNFLGQLNTVRIEELVAEKIFAALATSIEVAISKKIKGA